METDELCQYALYVQGMYSYSLHIVSTPEKVSSQMCVRRGGDSVCMGEHHKP